MDLATTNGAGRSLLDSIRFLWDYRLFTIEDRPLTVGSLVVFILLLVIGLWLSGVLSRMLAAALVRRFHVNAGPAAAIRTLIYYLFVACVIVFSLHVINVPLTIFAVAGGAIAIGVGFGSQNVINNFISGLILLIERPVRVGDFVQIEDFTGVVRAIGARSTRVITGENVEVVVPNSTLLQTNVRNWTLTTDEVRADIAIGVAYGSPVEQVRDLLLQAASEHEKVMKDPPVEVSFEDFGDNALVFRLYFWLRMSKPVTRRRTQSDLRFAIDRLFREAGITIAFPQRDLHIDTLRPMEVRLLRDTPPPPDARSLAE